LREIATAYDVFTEQRASGRAAARASAAIASSYDASASAGLRRAT
jgi:hypothetical protein